MSEVQDAHIGEKIKRLRSFRGMTCAELADAIGCTRPYLSAVENGRYPASTKILRKLQSALNVGVDYFTTVREPSLEDTNSYLAEHYKAGGTEKIDKSSSDTERVETRHTGGTRMIPFVALSESGEPSIEFDEYPSGDTDTIECPGDIQDTQAFAVRVDGDDMAPVIPPGSMAYVAPNKSVKENRPVIVKLTSGELICRRYQARHGQVILAPANPGRLVRLIDAADVDWIYPVVKVVIDLYNDPPKTKAQP
jgi:transcriptional regulator with XRE-family HTH domain